MVIERSRDLGGRASWWSSKLLVERSRDHGERASRLSSEIETTLIERTDGRAKSRLFHS
jgi:hypothetical protein